MKASGTTANSGSTAKTAASSRPTTIIALRDTRSAIQPNTGSPRSRAAGQAATMMPRVGRSTPRSVKYSGRIGRSAPKPSQITASAMSRGSIRLHAESQAVRRLCTGS